MKDTKFRISGLLLLLAFCFLQPLAAQEKSSTATGLHSLWKVEGKSNTVYLLGSIHLLKPENFPLAPPLETAFSNATVVVFETDIEKMEDPQLQMKMLAKAKLPDGETLKDHLSAETYASFTSHAKGSGLPLEMLTSMKPAMASFVLSMVELTKLGADPENGLDKMLNEMLREAPSIHKRLLTDRSKTWIPKIEELLRGEKNAIVIVGVGHLVGTEGVVELLKKKGLKVTQQ